MRCTVKHVLQITVFCFSFYQIRASMKIPPRIPHILEASLLHGTGKCKNFSKLGHYLALLIEGLHFLSYIVITNIEVF